ncbi:hypothetical protein HDU97_008956 [Phlyctochytrium planicorne]|nr:hypothetical protein HDU97_008956 [Phlyctochytrium planicorne]
MRTLAFTFVLVVVYVVISSTLEKAADVSTGSDGHHRHHKPGSHASNPPKSGGIAYSLNPSYVNLSGAGLYNFQNAPNRPMFSRPQKDYANLPPILPPKQMKILSGITKLGANRYFQAKGFEFCTALDGAWFDSLTVINEWGVSVAKRNPSMKEFVGFIDKNARRIMLLIYGRNQFLETQELSRFSCYAAAEGWNSVANISDTRLLHMVDAATYLGPIIPTIKPSKSRITGLRRRYKIAYLIMTHGDETVVENVKTLVDELDDGSAIFLIHVDPDSEILNQHLLKFIREREEYIRRRNRARRTDDQPVNDDEPGNIFMAVYRYSGLYGHAGQVWMQLSGFFELYDLAEWDYVINLSAFDVPMRKSREIARFLDLEDNRGKEFIASWGDFQEMAVRFVRPHILRTDPTALEFVTYHPAEAGLMYPPFHSWRVCRQHQWMMLTRRFIGHLRTSNEAVTALAFAEHSWVPDENYFCYVAINTPEFSSHVVAENKRYVTFQKMHARYLEIQQHEELEVPGMLDDPGFDESNPLNPLKPIESLGSSEKKGVQEGWKEDEDEEDEEDELTDVEKKNGNQQQREGRKDEVEKPQLVSPDQKKKKREERNAVGAEPIADQNQVQNVGGANKKSQRKNKVVHVSSERDNPRYLFVRKVDVRTKGGRELKEWIKKNFSDRFLCKVPGFYKGLDGAKWSMDDYGLKSGSQQQNIGEGKK